MALTASGFYGPSGDVAPSGTTFNIVVDSTMDVGYIKAGGDNKVSNSETATALRQKKFKGVTINTTSTTIAHGLTDSNGNPLVPTLFVQNAGPGVAAMTAEADATNIYVLATAAGSYDFTLVY
jgi:hypothetical protein